MNLDKIIERVTGEDTNLLYSGNLKVTKDCMKEAVRQALEEACERAEIHICIECEESKTGLKTDVYEVSKESIMSVIEEIE